MKIYNIINYVESYITYLRTFLLFMRIILDDSTVEILHFYDTNCSEDSDTEMLHAYHETGSNQGS